MRQFAKTLNKYFYLSWENENLEICLQVLSEQLRESNQFSDNFIG